MKHVIASPAKESPAIERVFTRQGIALLRASQLLAMTKISTRSTSLRGGTTKQVIASPAKQSPRKLKDFYSLGDCFALCLAITKTINKII